MLGWFTWGFRFGRARIGSCGGSCIRTNRVSRRVNHEIERRRRRASCSRSRLTSVTILLVDANRLLYTSSSKVIKRTISTTNTKYWLLLFVTMMSDEHERVGCAWINDFAITNRLGYRGITRHEYARFEEFEWTGTFG